jgi:polyisoprenoid-binding protein YceI
MEKMTLETAQFPKIVLRSSRSEKQGRAQWQIEGDLSVQRVTKPLSST